MLRYILATWPVVRSINHRRLAEVSPRCTPSIEMKVERAHENVVRHHSRHLPPEHLRCPRRTLRR